MAHTESITIPAHHNVYNGATGRELRIDFSIPSEGVNEKTGLLLFVPGFGGNIDSKVYTKMRDLFADRYNFVTIQCSYFGDQFMQGADNFTVHNIEGYAKKYFSIKEFQNY